MTWVLDNTVHYYGTWAVLNLLSPPSFTEFRITFIIHLWCCCDSFYLLPPNYLLIWKKKSGFTYAIFEVCLVSCWCMFSHFVWIFSVDLILAIITILISSDLHSSGFKMCNNGVVFILAFQVFKDVQNFGVKSLKSVGKEVLSLPSSAPDTRLWLYTPSFLTFSFCPSWWLLPNLYLQLRPLSWFPHNQLSLVTQLSPDRSESACVTLELRPCLPPPPTLTNKQKSQWIFFFFQRSLSKWCRSFSWSVWLFLLSPEAQSIIPVNSTFQTSLEPICVFILLTPLWSGLHPSITWGMTHGPAH